jgi:hypothetical protein
MSNTTLDATSWAAWSLHLPRNDNHHFVIAASILPVLCLVHSLHMHGKSTTQVRVISDTAAVFQFLSALAFLNCKVLVTEGSCGVLEKALAYNVLSDVICGGMVLGCDFWLTYSRYKDLRAILASVGITDDEEHVSLSHRMFALFWVIIFNFFTWVPFETMVPFFVDMNSPTMNQQWILWSWINDAAMVRRDVVTEASSLDRSIDRSIDRSVDSFALLMWQQTSLCVLMLWICARHIYNLPCRFVLHRLYIASRMFS